MTVVLTKYEPIGLPGAPTALWYLEVTAAVSGATPAIGNGIFINQRNTVSSLDDLFASVASASALVELPLEKDAAENQSYYRTDLAKFLCRSAAELEDVWNSLCSDVQMLVNDWNKTSTVSTTATVTIAPTI